MIANALRFVVAFAVFITTLNAQEQAKWFVGVGAGYGETQIARKYSESSRSGGLNVVWQAGTWIDQYDRHYKSAGLGLEAIVGYKHFLNDFIGFRYYANVGTIFYKDSVFSGDKTTIGVIDYTLNADFLLNFYDNPTISFGVFGGFGVGGAYFDSPEIDAYQSLFGGSIDSTQNTEPEFAGAGEVYKHHFSAFINAGIRINFLQELSGGNRVCSAGGDGKRSCKITTSSIEHSLEASARFPMLSYKATNPPDLMGRYCDDTTGNNVGYKCGRMRYAYEIKNPYKITLRYIIAF